MDRTSQNATVPVMSADEGSIDLATLLSVINQGKWLIFGITAAFAAVAIAYFLSAPPWYRAEVLLAPATAKSTDGLAGQLGSLGGLASLAGLTVGGGSTSEPLAVLKSRDFSRAFIEQQNLLPILFSSDWNATAARWIPKDPKDWPDTRDGVKYFNEKVRAVLEDKKTGLITLTVEWKDANLAASWANLIVDRVNESMRARALVEAQANVSYLQHELAAASVVTLQQSIGRLLDSELQKLMLARGKTEFAFRIIDRAEVPKWRSRPKLAPILALATVFGAALGVLLAFLRHSVRQRRSTVE
jgi:uncharacterized protein involved in exopolysaccharide biosynthesis